MKGERIAIICLTAGLITIGATTYTGKEIKQVEVVQEYQDNNLELEKLGKKNPLKRDHVGREKGYNGKTKKEICIEMLNNGYTYKQIAKQLGIKVSTVEQYKRDYNRKHHKPNRTYHKRS